MTLLNYNYTEVRKQRRSRLCIYMDIHIYIYIYVLTYAFELFFQQDLVLAISDSKIIMRIVILIHTVAGIGSANG